MVDNEHKRAFIRPHKRLSGATQIAAATLGGFDIQYVVGGNVDDWPEYAAQVDDGDLCAVYRLVLLVSPDLKPEARRAELKEAVRQIEDAGGVLFELESGRSTATRDDRDDMISDAWEAIASGQLVPKSGGKQGRKPKPITPEMWANAERLWFDRRFKSWRDVAAQLPPGITEKDCWLRFGPRKI